MTTKKTVVHLSQLTDCTLSEIREIVEKWIEEYGENATLVEKRSWDESIYYIQTTEE
jgi:hypothetical protein